MESTTADLVNAASVVVLAATAMVLAGIGFIAAAVIHVMKGGR